MKPRKLLTEVELELMHVLWRHGGATATEVQQALLPHRKLAYTSVSTMLRILEQKSFVVAVKEGRGHRYVPELLKSEYEAQSLDHLVENVFEGTPASLVRCLLEKETLDPQELSAIKKLLDEKMS